MPSPIRRRTRPASRSTTSPPPGTATRSPMPSSPTPSPAGATVARSRPRRDNLASSRAEPSMHTLSIPQSVVARVIERRGREHIYENLDPAKTALVVVDMQNAFMLPGVAHSLCPMAEKIVPNINRLARAVRDTGGTGFLIKTTFTQEALRDWSTYFEMVSPERVAKRLAALTPDSEGHARSRGLDTVLVTGTVTNVCCESTARDAMMLNFKTIMVTDANAATTDDDHNASLSAFYLSFGDIMSTDMLIGCLKRNDGKRAAAE